MNPIPSIDLSPGSLVISDLHLDAAGPGEHAVFQDFLRAARGRPALLILGDLFDAWVGPAHARLPGADPVLRALRDATAAGLSISLVHGNRDFLLDEDFARATGVRLCPEGIVAHVGERSKVLFVHGDELCTLDRSYQRLKRIVRSRPARWLAPRLPDALALGLARRLRKASKAAIEQKPAATKRQQPDEVRSRAAEVGAEVVVCGHAHEFRDERVFGGPRWIVLDAFGGARDLLEIAAGGELETGSSAAFTRCGLPAPRAQA